MNKINELKVGASYGIFDSKYTYCLTYENSIGITLSLIEMYTDERWKVIRVVFISQDYVIINLNSIILNYAKHHLYDD